MEYNKFLRNASVALLLCIPPCIAGLGDGLNNVADSMNCDAGLQRRFSVVPNQNGNGVADPRVVGYNKIKRIIEHALSSDVTRSMLDDRIFPWINRLVQDKNMPELKFYVENNLYRYFIKSVASLYLEGLYNNTLTPDDKIFYSSRTQEILGKTEEKGNLIQNRQFNGNVPFFRKDTYEANLTNVIFAIDDYEKQLTQGQSSPISLDVQQTLETLKNNNASR